MSDMCVALAGNPNVGKSTIFNALTGMRQHTGNWSGKTVDTARGTYRDGQGDIRLVDLPGTYSLFSLSPEERIAGEYVESGEADTTVVVCDASSLERNLILVLQVLSLTDRAVVCVNLMDEAKKRGVTVDITKLSEILGVTVVGTSASRREGLPELITAIRESVDRDSEPRFAFKGDETATEASRIAAECTTAPDETSVIRARRLDRIFTGRATGVPVMLLMLFGVLWLTVVGANKPSELLSNRLFYVGSLLRSFLCGLGAHEMVVGALVDGIYNTTAWVVGVMLPPMAIFFPLFTVLEDLGYLPRVAFNLDGVFRRCGSCGKQSLTMCLRQKSVRIKRQIREML